jgi:hypothetical protein
MKQTWLDFLLIVFAAMFFFAKSSSAYFCGYDDFGETHRAVFEDSGNPLRIFTTTHFGSTKYRPLNRLSTLLLWKIGDGSPLPFRIRNLFFHLICVLAVYGIALRWTRQHHIALVAGLLFCLEPVANQNISAAVFTNTAAYALLLTGFLLFLIWAESNRRVWLAFSLLLVLIGMFWYEPVIVVFPMMVAYLFLEKRGSDRLIARKEALGFFGGSLLVLLVFASIRSLVVHGGNPLVPFQTMIHNAILYTGGLLAPVDVVAANQLFGYPLPPELHLGRKILDPLLSVGVALVLGLFALSRVPGLRDAVRSLDKGLVLFLTLSIPFALAPFILFTPHPSETYLYLPAALYCILLSTLLSALRPSKIIYRSAVGLILLSFGIGTWIRNQRVVECGQTARYIISGLPVTQWTKGTWYIQLSDFPGEELPPRYGIYAYQGLATIDPGDPDTGNGAQNALQLATGNMELKARVISPAEMGASCAIPDTCFEVSRSGSVRAIKPTPNQN